MRPKHRPFIEQLMQRPYPKYCVLWPFGVSGNGYGATTNAGGQQINAHRAILEVTTGESGDYALHSCRQRLCVNPAHLRWGTNSDNMQDKLKDDTHNRGTRHGQNRYTEDQVREVRSTDGTKAELLPLAERWGSDWHYLDLIYRRKRWDWFE